VWKIFKGERIQLSLQYQEGVLGENNQKKNVKGQGLQNRRTRKGARKRKGHEKERTPGEGKGNEEKGPQKKDALPEELIPDHGNTEKKRNGIVQAKNYKGLKEGGQAGGINSMVKGGEGNEVVGQHSFRDKKGSQRRGERKPERNPRTIRLPKEKSKKKECFQKGKTRERDSRSNRNRKERPGALPIWR